MNERDQLKAEVERLRKISRLMPEALAGLRHQAEFHVSLIADIESALSTAAQEKKR